MNQSETKAMELTEFMKKHVPSGWKESIGTVCHIKRFTWYEIEAIEEWFHSKNKETLNNDNAKERTS